jgi:hypothetical protein
MVTYCLRHFQHERVIFVVKVMCSPKTVFWLHTMLAGIDEVVQILFVCLLD